MPAAPTPPLSIAEWRSLAAQGGLALAREIHRRIHAQLGPRQADAVFAQVMSESAIATEAATGPEDLPLSGVPYVIKDLFDVRNVPTRAGSGFLHEVRPVPVHDSEIVRILRARGALLAGKTHLHEFAYGLTGENPFWGRCENPLDPGRTTGGSSSGSAAAVAAGIVPFAIGTDTGGSVRVPASHCGLYGLRLTPGRPWIADAFPLAPSCDTVGWFARTPSDLRVVTEALLGGPHGKSTGDAAFLEYGRLDEDVRAAFLRHAPELGRPLERDAAEVMAAAFSGAADAYTVLTSREAAAVHAGWLDAHRARYSPQVWERIDRGRRWTRGDIERASTVRDRVRSAFAAYFETHASLVLPAAPSAAPRHAECAGYDRTRILDLAAPASLAGLPVLTIPIPLPGGLSCGMQVVAREAWSGPLADALGVAENSIPTVPSRA